MDKDFIVGFGAGKANGGGGGNSYTLKEMLLANAPTGDVVYVADETFLDILLWGIKASQN